MRYIKDFKLFEAVIMPTVLDNNSVVNSFESLVEYGIQNEFDVVGYDDFYNSMSEADQKNAPPRYGVPFFALFHPENKRPMFVCVDENAPRFIPGFKSIVDDIIGHEKVHAEQSRRKGDIDYSLPAPTDRKAYFANKEEIMAFSWTIANGLSKTNNNTQDAVKDLDSEDEPMHQPRGRRMPPPRPGGGGRPMPGGMPRRMDMPPQGPPPGMPPRKPEHKMIWNDIKRFSDQKVIKRYRKYIYMYLEEIFKNND